MLLSPIIKNIRHKDRNKKNPKKVNKEPQKEPTPEITPRKPMTEIFEKLENYLGRKKYG